MPISSLTEDEKQILLAYAMANVNVKALVDISVKDIVESLSPSTRMATSDMFEKTARETLSILDKGAVCRLNLFFECEKPEGLSEKKRTSFKGINYATF